jgi:hypothetical protein
VAVSVRSFDSHARPAVIACCLDLLAQVILAVDRFYFAVGSYGDKRSTEAMKPRTVMKLGRTRCQWRRNTLSQAAVRTVHVLELDLEKRNFEPRHEPPPSSGYREFQLHATMLSCP